MKKFFIPFFSFIIIIVIIGFVIWFNIPNIVAHMLTKEFNVPVSVQNVTITKKHLKIDDLNIGTPKGSKTDSSFFSKKIDVRSSLSQVRAETLTIDSFTLTNNIIGVEFYNSSGSSNNWTTLMNTPSKSKKETKKKYLIKKLTLNNITVVLTKENGQKQTFPTIEKLEFYNITDETGFPIDEIEKAIAQAILKSVFEKYNLLHLLEKVPGVNIIKKAIPIL
ncbi:MAG: hypothetical protein K1060chlam4_00168 [Candidatus Anoxychlamydiales bacterium]|nr:hypothetical protein [Candidatus Anoxychlamydiales bacterium]